MTILGLLKHLVSETWLAAWAASMRMRRPLHKFFIVAVRAASSMWLISRLLKCLPHKHLFKQRWSRSHTHKYSLTYTIVITLIVALMEFCHKVTIIIITCTAFTINLVCLEDSVWNDCVKRMSLCTYMYITWVYVVCCWYKW